MKGMHMNIEIRRIAARRATANASVLALGLSLFNLYGADLQWSEGPGYRSAILPLAARPGEAGFTRLFPQDTGINFTNILTDEKTAENQIRLNGSGVALGDVDGDGWCDIYLCGLENGNRLYRNLGQWKFEDITESAGVACSGQFSSGAVFADIDGDGDLDLLVTGVGVGTRLFINDGKGHFHEATQSGLARKFAGTTMALADIDGDGDLDLYVANYRTTTIRTTGLPLLSINGQLSIRPQDREDYELNPQGLIIEKGEPDILYINDGHGNFQAVPWTNGAFLDEQGQQLTQAPKDWGLSAAFRDLNGDGTPDLYVCNDFITPDRIWLNDGKGRFRAIPPLALRNTSTFSMAVDFADINRDGFDEIFLADMLDVNHQMRIVQFEFTESMPTGLAGMMERAQVNRNTLQLNRGDGTYAETAYYSGIESSGWTWSCICLDVDLDGYEDVIMSTGYPFDTQDLDAAARIAAMGKMGKNQKYKILMYPRLSLPRMAFRNLGNLRFEDASARWRFNDVGVSHGMAVADLDNDGDLDVVMNSLNEPARIYRNDCTAPRVAVRLKGLPPNTRGIGAKIAVRGGAVPLQTQEMMCGGRYLSGDDNLRVFAAGTNTNSLAIEVVWRSGKISTLTNLAQSHIYEIDEAAAHLAGSMASAQHPTPSTREHPVPLFEDISQLISHSHHDEPFDDFQRQPLLPKKLSQLGPGIAWGDLDGDGWDDLIVGSGRGGRLAAFRNNGKGGFTPFSGKNFEHVVNGDQTGIVVSYHKKAENRILAGSANYELTTKQRASVEAINSATGTIEPAVDDTESSTGPLALGDVYGDGSLCLFVGGRVIPGRYPEPATSRLYRERDGKFELDTNNSGIFKQVGLVSGAVFSDLDGDGFPELILACEWGPIKIFRNDHGKLSPWDPAISTPDAPSSTLSSFSGWWNGITAADLDGDGRMDLIAGNWGLNTQYRATPENPRKIYYGDFAESGSVATIETYFDRRMGKEVPEREFDAVAAAMPFLRGIFPSHRAYGEAGISEVLGEKLKTARQVSASTLASMVFLNRGDYFEARPLPPEAQFAPVFAVVAADFDGDGNEDVFLSQNFFDTEPQTSRCDAGRGLLLQGDGKGGLRPVPGQESGIAVYGEQRGAAAADYDQDGRVDLAVTQNATVTKLYHNRTAKPGLRVRVAGPPGNPTGVGAVMRLKSGERFGPAREIHAGAGYWSQDSPVQVLSRLPEPLKLWVRWPGGKTTIVDIPAGASEVESSSTGELKVK
jgi:enediyne biosynthesis protein E4